MVRERPGSPGFAEIQDFELVPIAKAGFFRRFVAIAIDWLFLSIISDILGYAYRLGIGTRPGTGHVDPAVALFFSTLLFILYFTLFTGDGGQTLGKMFLGIRVQRMDGSPVGYRCALLRTIGYIVSVFFGTFLGFLWALWDRNNQTWHDKIAGTRVIKI
jgi:uncharacterized RDD family membrane protein YckC